MGVKGQRAYSNQVCEECFKEFYAYGYKRRFCSRACADHDATNTGGNLGRLWKAGLMPPVSDEKREQSRRILLTNNPMDDPKIRAKYDDAMADRDRSFYTSEKHRATMRLAWTPKRRAELSRQMKSGSPLQNKMQMGGNRRRVGKPNVAALEYWSNLSEKEKIRRAENSSRKLIKRWKGVKRYPNGIQGFLVTDKFGSVRYDSTWEKAFLSAIDGRDDIVGIVRDVAIPYRFNGAVHHFLLDFRIEFSKGSPILVEIKCPYYLDTDVSRAKVRAARRYARKNGMRFVLLASKEEAEVADGI